MCQETKLRNNTALKLENSLNYEYQNKEITSAALPKALKPETILKSSNPKLALHTPPRAILTAEPPRS